MVLGLKDGVDCKVSTHIAMQIFIVQLRLIRQEKN